LRAALGFRELLLGVRWKYTLYSLVFFYFSFVYVLDCNVRWMALVLYIAKEEFKLSRTFKEYQMPQFVIPHLSLHIDKLRKDNPKSDNHSEDPRWFPHAMNSGRDHVDRGKQGVLAGQIRN